MTTYYVGIGGNDGNNGQSWANRKLTLNGAEDIPVAAGDTVYVGPGVYREMLTCDVAGSAGNIITYIGDVTGEHTDGIGGVVRVTGSDNDTTATRAASFSGVQNYRSFRGFTCDLTTGPAIAVGVSGPTVVEDCVFQGAGSSVAFGVAHGAATVAALTCRRCVFVGGTSGAPAIVATRDTYGTAGDLIENCVFLLRAGAQAYEVNRAGGCVIQNCLIVGGGGFNNAAIAANTLVANEDTLTARQNIIVFAAYGMYGAATGDITENYNNFWGCSTDRVNVDTGANSTTYPPMFNLPILQAGVSQVSGLKFPWMFGELSEWSALRRIAGADEPTTDLFGIPRPVTAAKNSWGAIQFQDVELEATTVQAGSYSRVLHDAGQVLVRRIPTTNTEITVTLYMRYEDDYAGDLPRMIIKQPGQADQTDTMTAAADTWEQLTATFTPAASPKYVEVWAESRNTAVADDYDVFFDTLDVA